MRMRGDKNAHAQIRLRMRTNLVLRLEREFDFLGGHFDASVYAWAGQAKDVSEAFNEKKL